jgi:hypothetical protein
MSQHMSCGSSMFTDCVKGDGELLGGLTSDTTHISVALDGSL